LKIVLKILFPLFFGFIFQINAQDIHFSQFANSPLNLNPANTGLSLCDYRFVANHRNQWQSITVPFRTLSASFDHKIKLLFGNFGVGVLLNSDKAGDSDFGTTQIGFNGAFHKVLGSDSIVFFSIGFGTNYNQKSLNYDALYFGNQFIGDKYDENQSSDELFSNTKISYFDLNLGVNLTFKIKKKTPINLGFAYSHANNTKQSFEFDKDVILDRRFSATISSDFKVGKALNFQPNILIMGQGKYRNYVFGGLFKNRVEDKSIENIYFGAWYRWKDAIVPQVSIDYKKFILGISYDINISDLRIASNYRGGLEISLIYNICKAKKVIVPFIKQCPVYM
jgi:type IX secretion system PorP/SprF family membrane protein